MSVYFKQWKPRLIYDFLVKHDGELISIKKISEETGLGESTVSAEIHYLIELRFIETDGRRYFVRRPSLIH